MRPRSPRGVCAARPGRDRDEAHIEVLEDILTVRQLLAKRGNVLSDCRLGVADLFQAAGRHGRSADTGCRSADTRSESSGRWQAVSLSLGRTFRGRI